jgi:hypothetical protein
LKAKTSAEFLKAGVSADGLRASYSAQGLQALVSAQVLRVAMVVADFVDLRSFAESPVATDLIGKTLHRALVDFVSVVDVAIKESLGKSLLDNSVGVSETTTLAFGKLAEDIIGAADQVVWAIEKARSDLVAAADTFDRAVEYLRTPNELVATTSAIDVFQKFSFLERGFADSAISGDALTKGLLRNLSETLLVVDYLTRSVDDPQTPVSAQDQLLKGAAKNAADLAETSDILQRVVEYLRTGDLDVEAVTDDDQTISFIKTTAESFAASDSIELITAQGRSFLHAALANDAAARQFVKQLVDSVAASAEISYIQYGDAFHNGPVEMAGFSDSGDLFLQGYVTEDYLAERYVGTEVTF